MWRDVKTTLILGIVGLTAITLLRAAPPTSAQPPVTSPQPIVIKKAADLAFKHPAFTFVRIQFSTEIPPGRTTTWDTDFPEADVNFTRHFQDEIGLKCETNRVMQLTNSELSRFPFVYLANVGRVHLNDAEVPSLRRYLLGGGFLMVDGMWGERDWMSLSAELKRVFPERELIELSIEHEAFHSYYDLRTKPQVPHFMIGIRSKTTGITWQREDGKEVHYRGLFDDKGRLMVIVCHNTHLGEGWEREREEEYFFHEFSEKRAYPMGINIVVYALTH